MDTFVTVGLEGGVYGISVGIVREVLDSVDLSPIPNAPHGVLGMIDIRGKSVAVLSLRDKFGLPPSCCDADSRILIVEIPSAQGGLVLGVMTDCVFDVTALADAPLEEAPKIGAHWDSSFISGVARRNGRFIVILDVERLFTERDLIRARSPFEGFDLCDDGHAGE